jgi:DNA-directed RNA polymerase subunit RPC12/RpoP
MPRPAVPQTPPASAADGTVPLTRRKAVLFCSTCGHEDRVDGDWLVGVDRGSGTREIRCPTCETTLTTRPLPEPASDDAATGSRTVLTAATDQLADLWTASLGVWFPWFRADDRPGRSDC